MKSRRWLLIPFALLAMAGAIPVSADQWYEHYARGEKALLDGDHATAIGELNQALERRGDSGARVRTYGMRVVDYFPYLKLGIAYFAAGEYEAALRAFDTEEQLGAVQNSETASGELTRFRRRATEGLERKRAEQQQAVDIIVAENLSEARNLSLAGQLDDALVAVGRVLALAPDNSEANELATAVRDELAHQVDEASRKNRADELMAQGHRLRSDGEPAQAAARFRQAMDLAPQSEAGELLREIQTELADSRSVEPSENSEGQLQRAVVAFEAGELELSLELIQQVIAVAPQGAEAAELERRILFAIAEKDRAREIDGLLRDAAGRLAADDPEGAITAANLVLARDRGQAEALRLIQLAYATLSRRLLGEGAVQNLPPAIRFADMRDKGPDGSLVHQVREPGFRLSGVVIDDSEVIVTAMASGGVEATTDLSSQDVGGVTITEFRMAAVLAGGLTVFEVVATDSEGLSTRSEYTVDYHRPLARSPWAWGAVIALSFLVIAVVVIRKALHRRRLLRRRFNPYVAGPPVLDPRLFVGRDDLVDRVLATVPNNSLLLLGERRIGKTSMLHQLSLQLPKLDHPRFCFVPVPIDLQGVAEDAFFATVAEAVGETIGDERMSTARSVEGYDSRELVRDLRRVLPTVECEDDRQAKLVLLFDEIDELNGYSHRTNQRLRSLFMKGFADQLVAVAAGVGIAREWDHEGSPWYNFFEELEVGPVDSGAARRLITEPLAGVIAIDDGAVDRLLAVADGRPYLLQKLALAAVQRIHEEGRSRITLEDVEAVI